MRDRISGKVSLVRCDRHRRNRMHPVTIRAVGQVPEKDEIDALHCDFPDCNRHYRTDFGYFDLEIGDQIELDLGKLRCSEHFDRPCLFIEEVGPEKWQYVCPFDGCDARRPM